MDHNYSVLSSVITSNEPCPKSMTEFNRIICDFMREQNIPGASLCIYYNGEPWYKQGYGTARAGQCITSGSYLRIASISKVFTTIGVMRLVEEKKLNLDQTVFDSKGILPKFKCHHNDQRRITVLHLLQHSAGWDRDVQGDQVYWFSDPQHARHIDVHDNHSLVQYVLKHELAFEPGTKHAYSNLTYLLLGMIIETVTGQPYGEYIVSVMKCLEVDVYVGSTLQTDCSEFMEGKYFNNSKSQTEQSIFNKDFQVAPQYGSFPMENSAAYGGLVTCAEHLVKMLDSLVPGCTETGILSPDTVKLMKKKPIYCRSGDWYGLGLDVEDNGKSFGHTGAMDGTSSTVHHDKSGFTWALVLNSWAKDMDLNGLIKYALSNVEGCVLWQSVLKVLDNNLTTILSSDRKQCVSVHVPYKDLESHANNMKQNGYYISYISAISLNHNIHFNVIWNINETQRPNDWYICWNIAWTDTNNFIEHIRCGGRNDKVCLCQTYILDDNVYNMFVCASAQTGLTQHVTCSDETKHEINVKTLNSAGFTLDCQSVVSFKGVLYITAVFSKMEMHGTISKTDQTQWSNLPVERFTSAIEEKFKQKYRLDYLHFYPTHEQPRVSAIWTKLDISKKAFEKHIVYQRYNVSKYGILSDLCESMRQNQRVKCLCSYTDEEGNMLYVCIWGRYNRTKRKHKVFLGRKHCGK